MRDQPANWRDNPVLVSCVDRFRQELQAIKNNQPYNMYNTPINQIRFRRKQLGLSQRELSKLAQISHSSVNAAENDGATALVIVKIEDALDRLEDEQDRQLTLLEQRVN